MVKVRAKIFYLSNYDRENWGPMVYAHDTDTGFDIRACNSHNVIIEPGQRVVIPVCQIQDLHRTQGPIMMLLKMSGVTISTAGSNFNISTLTTDEADHMIDELEHHLETRIEELKNEEI